MTTIYFVRHCDVENPRGVIYGRLPGFGLSALGRQQLELLAAYFSIRPLAAIYSSPQLRARETAAGISRHHGHLKVRIAPSLAEVRVSYEGQTGPPANRVPNDPADETMREVLRRMQRFVAFARRRYRGEEIVAVSHATPIGVLRAGLEGWPASNERYRSLEPAKGAVTAVRFQGGEEGAVDVEYVDVAATTVI